MYHGGLESQQFINNQIFFDYSNLQNIIYLCNILKLRDIDFISLQILLNKNIQSSILH